MQSYYAARAPEYDQVYQKPERQADLRALETTMPALFAKRSVLEVACGTGYWTQFLAPLAANIVALDAAPETLAIARQRVPAASVQFVVGDAWDLPHSTPQPDAAFAGFWFSHIPKQQRTLFLAGLHQRLQAGAKVVFLDNRYVAGSSTPVAEVDANGDSWQIRPLADGSTHRVMKNFPEEVELHAMIAGLGHGGKFMVWEYFWMFEYECGAK
jgi:demethylmenaquinone methyltransferase/2-methoxy-6-polyprenyl-1,4-benzoquinol methylase